MSKLKQVLCLVSVFGTACVLVMVVAPSARAARNDTAVVCQAGVRLAGHGNLDDGRKYVTIEYHLDGNDNARRFLLGNGSTPAEPGWFTNSAGNCTKLGGGVFWDGERVDLSSKAYKDLFKQWTGFETAQDVYFGLPKDAKYNIDPYDDYTNGNIGWYDASQGNPQRPTLGITPNNDPATPEFNKNTIFATVNDAGYIFLNNKRVWCLGMDVDVPYINGASCRGGDAARAYVGGGDFAGWQNSDNPRARANVSDEFRPRLDSQASVKDLLGITPSKQFFNLSMAAQNTRDSVPLNMAFQCLNTKPGTPPCVPGKDPLINTKTSAIITYVFGEDFDLRSEIRPKPPLNLSPGANLQPGTTYDFQAQIKNYSKKLNVRGGLGSQLTVRVTGSGRNFINGEKQTVPAATTPTISANFGVNTSSRPNYFPNGDSAQNPASPVNSGCGVGAPDGDGAKRWCWWYSQMGKNGDGENPQVNYNYQSIWQDFRFTIAPNATPGTSFCLKPQAYIGSLALGTGRDGSEWCFTIGETGEGRYMRVYGNDVMAGGSFSTVGSISCGLPAESSIKGLYRNPTVLGQENWAGAGSQFAAIATGDIQGFFSAAMRNPGSNTENARPPTGLTFGNIGQPPTSDAKLGINNGGHSGFSNCVDDYFGEAIARGATLSSPQVGAMTVGETVPLHHAVVIEGEAYVTGNVVYTNQNGSWGASVDNIPSFMLVVKGNIYIDENVTELNGIYIAQPDNDGKKGVIVTCTSDGFGTVPNSPGRCTNKLTINGALIARQVRFKRIAGNLQAATPNEAANSGNIAEVINFSPEIYLSPLNSKFERSLPFTKYDYITSLPPVL